LPLPYIPKTGEQFTRQSIHDEARQLVGRQFLQGIGTTAFPFVDQVTLEALGKQMAGAFRTTSRIAGLALFPQPGTVRARSAAELAVDGK
jgi:hypothetical protein